MINNRIFTLSKSTLPALTDLPEIIHGLADHEILRWNISSVTEKTLTVEATTYDGKLLPFEEHVKDEFYPGRSAVVSIIPTGVGCEIGGYAGDAAPVTNLLSAAADYLVTNPNAVNASNFISLDPNVVYTEGSVIDMFCMGQVNLHLPYTNRVGLIIEGSSSKNLDVVFNIVNTVRAVYGVNIQDYVITDSPIGSRCARNESGAFVGTIDHPDVLFRACEELLARGVNAIAVTTNVQDLPPDAYVDHFAGRCPNPVGGVESVISHLITRTYHVPAAHAPFINIKQLDLEHSIVDARGAGEMSSASGLACILIGLRRSPQIRTHPSSRIADMLNVNNISAVVAPAGCLGGIPVLYALKYNIPVIAVRENQTILDVTRSRLQLDSVIEVENYAEAAGILLALRKGINLETIRRPLLTLRHATEPVKIADLLTAETNQEPELISAS